MAPRYPARDGYPSMFELEDTPGSTGATKLHQTTTNMTVHPRHDARTAKGAKSEAWARAEVPELEAFLEERAPKTARR
jgi:hypothetical protein